MKQGDAKENENGAEREPTKEELEAEFDLNDEGMSHLKYYIIAKSCEFINKLLSLSPRLLLKKRKLMA